MNSKKYLVRITLLCFIGFILLNLFTWLVVNFYERKVSDSLQADQYNVVIKQKYFLKNQHKYNLAFIGDSRTYCGMDPLLFDSVAGSSSVNLAVFAFWMPSQYCYFNDFIPQMDTSITLVWTIGTQNFLRVDKVNDSYPISVPHFLDLYKMGFKQEMISGNCIKHLPFLYFLSKRDKLFNGLNTRSKMVLREIQLKNETIAIPVSTPNEQSEKIASEDYSFSNVLKSIPIFDQGKITSYENLRSGGNYIRYEIDSLYFRGKQKELGVRFKDNARFTPDKEYYNCFVAILNLMKKHKIKLIVNEIEEAPFVYKDKKVRDIHREFMKDIESKTLEFGFKYTRVNFDPLQDWHYFDYNHFNSKGVLIYNTLLAQQIKPMLN